MRRVPTLPDGEPASRAQPRSLCNLRVVDENRFGRCVIVQNEVNLTLAFLRRERLKREHGLPGRKHCQHEFRHPLNITPGFDNNGDPNDRPPGVNRNTGQGPHASIDLHFAKESLFAKGKLVRRGRR
jgi:hypothetical protein